jgi:hypothetical protein
VQRSSAALIAAAWRAFRQSRAARAAARLAVALTEASHSAQRAVDSGNRSICSAATHRTAAAQVLIRSWRAIAARRRACTGCALLRAVHRPALQSALRLAQVHSSDDTPAKFLPSPVIFASTAPFQIAGTAQLQLQSQLQLPPGLGLMGSTVHPGLPSTVMLLWALRRGIRRTARLRSYPGSFQTCRCPRSALRAYLCRWGLTCSPTLAGLPSSATVRMRCSWCTSRQALCVMHRGLRYAHAMDASTSPTC